MNPGNGKVHRDCAARCISGGIPPAFLVRDAEGSRTMLLANLAPRMLDHVAEPVTLRGTAADTGGRLILYAGINTHAYSESAISFPKPVRRLAARVYEANTDDARPNVPIAERLLAYVGAGVAVTSADLLARPQDGRHDRGRESPFGILDGAALATLLDRARGDVRFLANGILTASRSCAISCIPANPWRRSARRDRAFRTRMAGMLVVFPAGEVSHLRWQRPRRCRRLPMESRGGAHGGDRAHGHRDRSCRPMCEGKNSALFQLAAGAPALRTAAPGRELLNKRGSRVEVRIGSPIASEKLLRHPVRARTGRLSALAHVPAGASASRRSHPARRVAATDRARLADDSRDASERSTLGRPGVYLARDPDGPAGTRPAARDHLPRRRRGHGQAARPRRVRRALPAPVRVERAPAGSRGRVPAGRHAMRTARPLYRDAVPLRRPLPRPPRAGARAGPLVRARRNIRRASRRCCCCGRASARTSRRQSAVPHAVRAGQHQRPIRRRSRAN